jgi:hypothetical protein
LYNKVKSVHLDTFCLRKQSVHLHFAQLNKVYENILFQHSNRNADGHKQRISKVICTIASPKKNWRSDNKLLLLLKQLPCAVLAADHGIFGSSGGGGGWKVRN